jgi:membrane protein DedA with SNARE-associated domain
VGYSQARWLVFNSVGVAIWVCFGFALGYLAYGPLKRYGDIGYYVVFGIIAVMIVAAVVRLVRMFRRRQAPADELAQSDSDGMQARAGATHADDRGAE